MGLTAVERAVHYAARSPRFAAVTPNHLAYFRSVLNKPCSTSQRKGKMLTDAEAIRSFSADWMRQVQGVAPAVLMPTCATHVSEILKYC
ncbi:hypothetical protein CUR178_05472 [Leishmania enriettii]|uniref:Uncharacterized protein n=1 Tax=Leishmania enriettii TaxID=5663 RepID=A0A836GPF5_LEIEN|nr:hypothetical protein CUR178_05472 [Leishmania enriettii]